MLSYFRPEGLPAKTKAMLAHAQSIEFLTTTTEKEALLLEASLIKKYRPHYNIVLRDDKQYVLFRVNIKHPFPRLEVVRKARRDGARYFWPPSPPHWPPARPGSCCTGPSPCAAAPTGP